MNTWVTSPAPCLVIQPSSTGDIKETLKVKSVKKNEKWRGGYGGGGGAGSGRGV